MTIYTVTLNPAFDREYTVPDLVFDDVLRSTPCRLDYGGKGFNVARALQAWNVPSVAMGFVGGLTGQRLTDGLESLGIATDLTSIAGETRTNTSIVAMNSGRYLKVNEPGATIQPEEVAALLSRVRERVEPGDWWVLAGSLPPGLPVTFYADLITLIQDAGGFAVLDTSGEPLRHGCAAGAFLVKPNVDEARALFGRGADETPVMLMREFYPLGVQNVVMSLGKEEALATNWGRTWAVTPPTIEERNPIGAGDTMVAGLVYVLSQGGTLPAALAWGVAAGAATASLDGTAVGSLALVEQLRENVPLRRVWLV